MSVYQSYRYPRWAIEKGLLELLTIECVRVSSGMLNCIQIAGDTITLSVACVGVAPDVELGHT